MTDEEALAYTSSSPGNSPKSESSKYMTDEEALSYANGDHPSSQTATTDKEPGTPANTTGWFGKRLVDNVAANPGEATKAFLGSAAEQIPGVIGGGLLAIPAAAAGTAIAPGPGTAAGGMLGFAAGQYATTKYVTKPIERALGLDKPLEEAQQAQPEASAVGGIVPLIPMAAESATKLAALKAAKGIGAVGKQMLAGAAGGVAFEPLRYAAESGVNAITGSDEPVAPITPSSVGQSALTMGLLAGTQIKPGEIPAKTGNDFKGLQTEPKKTSEEVATATAPEDQQAVDSRVDNLLNSGSPDTAAAVKEAAAVGVEESAVSVDRNKKVEEKVDEGTQAESEAFSLFPNDPDKQAQFEEAVKNGDQATALRLTQEATGGVTVDETSSPTESQIKAANEQTELPFQPGVPKANPDQTEFDFTPFHESQVSDAAIPQEPLIPAKQQFADAGQALGQLAANKTDARTDFPIGVSAPEATRDPNQLAAAFQNVVKTPEAPQAPEMSLQDAALSMPKDQFRAWAAQHGINIPADQLDAFHDRLNPNARTSGNPFDVLAGMGTKEPATPEPEPIPTVSQENIIGSNTGMLENLSKATDKIKYQFHREINQALIDPTTGRDVIAQSMGIEDPKSVATGRSAYVNPNGELEVNPVDMLGGFASKEDAQEYAMRRGALTGQNAVSGVRINPNGEQQALYFRTGKAPNMTTVTKAFSGIAHKGDTALYIRPDGFMLVRLGVSGKNNPHTDSQWKETLQRVQKATGVTPMPTMVETFYHENDFNNPNPKKDKYGIEFTKALAKINRPGNRATDDAAGRSGLPGRNLDDRAVARIEAVIKKYSDQGYGKSGRIQSDILGLGRDEVTPAQTEAPVSDAAPIGVDEAAKSLPEAEFKTWLSENGYPEMSAQAPAVVARMLKEGELTPQRLDLLEKFRALSQEQRGAPENAMLALPQHKGVVGWLAEHIGDLQHRMNEKAYLDLVDGEGYQGRGGIVEKVETALEKLNRSSFSADLNAVKIDAKTARALKVYADAHRNLKVYNKPQALARDAAVAVGEQKWEVVRQKLSELEALRQDPKEWAEEYYDKANPEGYVEESAPMQPETPVAEQQAPAIPAEKPSQRLIATAIGVPDGRIKSYVAKLGRPFESIREAKAYHAAWEKAKASKTAQDRRAEQGAALTLTKLLDQSVAKAKVHVDKLKGAKLKKYQELMARAEEEVNKDFGDSGTDRGVRGKLATLDSANREVVRQLAINRFAEDLAGFLSGAKKKNPEVVGIGNYLRANVNGKPTGTIPSSIAKVFEVLKKAGWDGESTYDENKLAKGLTEGSTGDPGEVPTRLRAPEPTEGTGSIGDSGKATDADVLRMAQDKVLSSDTSLEDRVLGATLLERDGNPSPEDAQQIKQMLDELVGVRGWYKAYRNAQARVHDTTLREFATGEDWETLRSRIGEGEAPETEETPKISETYTGRELIDRALSLTGENTLERKLAEILGKSRALENINVENWSGLKNQAFGEYVPGSRTIRINAARLQGNTADARTALHEIIHGLTHAFFDKGNAKFLDERQKIAVKNINDLFKAAKAEAIRQGLTSEEAIAAFSKDGTELPADASNHYGWTSVHEFMTEAMTNKDFQNVLKQIQVKDGTVTKLAPKSAWNVFKNAIRKLVGLPKPDNSALSHAIDNVLDLTQSDQKVAVVGYKNAAQNLLPKEQAKLEYETAKKFVDLFDKLPSVKEMASVALGGKVKKGWYRQSAQALVDIFGADSPRFAALLAATSPQTSVENNLINALNLWKNWSASGLKADPNLADMMDRSGAALSLLYKKKVGNVTVSIAPKEAMERWVRNGGSKESFNLGREQVELMGRSVMGSGTVDSVLEGWVGNSVRALNSEAPHDLVLSGPKVNSFARNLRDQVHEVTNDAWMANFAKIDQGLFGGSLNADRSDPGKGWGYLSMSARVRAAAKLLTKETGETWTPAEVQETVWSWAKTLYEAQKSGRNALEILRSGELTDEAIAGTPDFATLLNHGKYRSILEDAGYGKTLDELTSRSDASDAQGAAKPAAPRETGPLAPEAIQRNQERSARRLAELKEEREEAKANGETVEDGETLAARTQQRSTSQEENTDRLLDENKAGYEQPDYLTTPHKDAVSHADDLVNKLGTDGVYDAIKKDPGSIPKGYLPALLRRIQKGYYDKYVELKNSPGRDVIQKNQALERNKEMQDMLSAFGTETGQGLQALREIVHDAGSYVKEYVKGVLGNPIEKLTEGKINMGQLVDAIGGIHEDAANVTVDGATKLLSKFGVEGDGNMDTLKKVLSSPNTTKADLQVTLAKMMGEGASQEKINNLTNQIGTLFNGAAQKIARAKLPDAVHNAYAGGAATKGLPTMDKLSKLIGLGKFDEDKFNQTMLESLGISGYDAETVKKIRDMAERVQSLPEGSAQQNELRTEFQGMLGNEIINRNLEKGGKAAAFQAMSLLPDLFRSAILTGPPTFLTHGFSGFTNVRAQGLFQAIGEFAHSISEGHSISESAGFFNDFLETMLTGQKGERGSPFGREFVRALETGKMGLANAQNSGRGPADQMAKGVGGSGILGRTFRGYAQALGFLPRFMSAFDALNANSARELNQRFAVRSALLNGGVKGPEMANKMHEIFTPSQEELAAAKKALQDEVDAGFFKGFEGRQLSYLMKERMEQLHQQLASGEDLYHLLGGKEVDQKQKDWTFKGEFKGVFGLVADKVLGGLNRSTGLTKFIFPFTRIISNLMNNSLEYTPMGLLKANNISIANSMLGEESPYAFRKYEPGSADQMALMAKSILGSTVAMTVTAWFLKELHDEQETGKEPQFTFYGAGPLDPAKRGEMMAAGWRPNTIKVGKTYIPYKALPGLDLLATSLGTLHDYVTYQMPTPKGHHGQPPTAQDIADSRNLLSGDKLWRVAIGVAMSPLEHHFLSGAKNLISILHDPQGVSTPMAVVNQVVGTASQFTNPQILRVIRNSVAAESNGNVNDLDLNTVAGRASQFVPFYAGYNQAKLNVLGDPIQHKPTDPLTDRWLYAAHAAPDAIITPLVDNGLFIPGPKKSTAILVNDQGQYKTLNDTGDAAWLAYGKYRGEFLKEALSPDVVQQLISMDRTTAQSILDGPSINAAASRYASQMVEEQILSGKIKVKGV